MKIEVVDRHAEHVDETIPLCAHDVLDVGVGDHALINVSMETAAWLWTSKLIEAKCQVEVEVVGRNKIRVIVNQPDYLTAKANKRS